MAQIARLSKTCFSRALGMLAHFGDSYHAVMKSKWPLEEAPRRQSVPNSQPDK